MRKALLLATTTMLTMTSFAAAAEIEIKMLNKGSGGGEAKQVFATLFEKLEASKTAAK